MSIHAIDAFSISQTAATTYTADSSWHAEDDFDDVAYKSDDEEGDVMSIVAAISKRDAQLQSQLPQPSTAAADDF